MLAIRLDYFVVLGLVKLLDMMSGLIRNHEQGHHMEEFGFGVSPKLNENHFFSTFYSNPTE